MQEAFTFEVGIVSELSDDWLSTRNNWGILNDGGEGMKKVCIILRPHLANLFFDVLSIQ